MKQSLPERMWALSRLMHRSPLRPLARGVKGLNYVLWRAFLPQQCEVGEGVQLRHLGFGVLIHPNTRIGAGTVIWTKATLGSDAPIGGGGGIVVGERVEIGSGASIIASGGRTVTIGDGARIGAGAVVTKDVPAGATVVAPASRVILAQ
jgi:serine O-acetyltransferase